MCHFPHELIKQSWINDDNVSNIHNNNDSRSPTLLLLLEMFNFASPSFNVDQTTNYYLGSTQHC